MCFEKSFASHNKFICWSIENKFKPMEVFKKSKKIEKKGNKKLQPSLKKWSGLVVCKNVRLEIGRNETTL